MMEFLDFRNRPAQERGLRPELRRLIDEAVAAGRVTVIPRGVSSIPQPKWDDEKGELVSPSTRTEKQRAADKRRAINASRIRHGQGVAK